MFRLTQSNRFETLLDALLQNLEQTAPDVFLADEIIVASAAVQRHIEHAIADTRGICLNTRFSYLAQWLWTQIGKLIPVSARSPFAPDTLVWRILGAFQDASFIASHPRLQRYLSQADELMAFTLAQETATLFEQYLVYRTDWLTRWQEGQSVVALEQSPDNIVDQAWQSALWRRIARDLGTPDAHPASAFFERLERASDFTIRGLGLPPHAHIFALPSMPPLYLDMLKRLSRFMQLHVYVLNPCQEYWFDVVDAKRLAWLKAQGRAQHHDTGNRLLSSWGKQTQIYLDELLAIDGVLDLVEENFVASQPDTRLAQVQNHILSLNEPKRGSMTINPADRSLEIHVCHSLTRELEVLHDQLLAIFKEPNAPQASDILVVTPHLEEAAPYIDAVFGATPRTRVIPYVITGRPARTQNEVALPFLAVLDVASSRFKVSEVFDLLHQPLIASHFLIDANQKKRIHQWLRDTGIHWGVDGAHRQDLGLPFSTHNTFAEGFHQLFLGYALPDAYGHSVVPHLARPHIEGSRALTLGRLYHLLSNLSALNKQISQSQTGGQWATTLLAVLDNFVATSTETHEDRLTLQNCIRELTTDICEGSYPHPVAFAVIRRALESRLQQINLGGIPSGSVTFASLSSLRQLPYRVICVLGLNDGDFPSLQRPYAFDLMHQAPRRTDRQRRLDDKGIFLDLIVAARERLYVSYCGRSIHDNSPLPPSVLVSDLLDFCLNAMTEDAQGSESWQSARDCLVIEHPLQPFSASYFVTDADPRRLSFNEEYGLALQAQSEQPTRPFATPLPPEANTSREIDLSDLLAFFRNPCRHYLKNRLGITLPYYDDELNDEEPFKAASLSRKQLAEQLLPAWLSTGQMPATAELPDVVNAYPAGVIGSLERKQELTRMQRFVDRVRTGLQEPTLPQQETIVTLSVNSDTWYLQGQLIDERATGLVQYRYADLKAKDFLSAWIQHLFLHAARPGQSDLTTKVHGLNQSVTFLPVANAQDELAKLIERYIRGSLTPLHFFPETSWAYVNAEPAAAMAKARQTWTASYPFPGEDQNANFRLALRGIDNPLDDAFIDCSESVFRPLLAHRQNEPDV